MQYKQVRAVFYSPTGTTRKIVITVAKKLGECLNLPVRMGKYTTPADRKSPLVFEPTDLVVFGSPTYAGRVPNLMLPYLRTIKGNGATAVPIVLFGNRDFDNSLIELRDLLENAGCHTIAAAAFVGQHSFSMTLAKDRPDASDLDKAERFAEQVAAKLMKWSPTNGPITVEGKPGPEYGGYLRPLGAAGEFIDIRKVKPLTTDDCDQCGICALICPMGAISFEDAFLVPGICVKCNACVKLCPKNAKYFADGDFLHHVSDLEQTYTRRAEPHIFV